MTLSCISKAKIIGRTIWGCPTAVEIGRVSAAPVHTPMQHFGDTGKRSLSASTCVKQIVHLLIAFDSTEPLLRGDDA
jgi:hypothetical protein